MTSFEKNLKNIFSIDDTTLLVAFLPVLGYCVAYIFELGYLSYFDIPSHFIQIDLVGTLKTTAIIVFSLYLVVSIYGLAFDLKKNSHPFWQVVGDAIINVSLLGIVIYLNIGTDMRFVWILIGLFLLSILLELIPPLFNKNFSSYWQRVMHNLAPNIGSTASSSKSKSIFKELIFRGFMVFLVFMFIIGLGLRHAKNETQFWTIKYQPDVVVIRVYGDTILAKSVDLNTHETNDGIEVFKIDSTPLSITKSSINFLITKTDKKFSNQFTNK